ncbi:MAG: hypothetical protein ACOX87_01475, partial [Chloroflexota bacterium]
HSVFLPIPGYWTPDASAFSQTKHAFGRSTLRQVWAKGLWETDVGLSVDADIIVPLFGLKMPEQIGPYKPAISDQDGMQGRGNHGEQVVYQMLFDVVLAKEAFHGLEAGLPFWPLMGRGWCIWQLALGQESTGGKQAFSLERW